MRRSVRIALLLCALVPCLSAQAEGATPLFRALCPLPSIDPEDEFIALGVENGATLTNVTMGSKEEPTSLVTLTVREGERPLTLFVIATENVIWDFVGAVGRIRRVIAAGPKEGTAYRGLSSDRVNIVRDMSDCFLGPRIARRPKSIERAFDRAPDHATFVEHAEDVVIPDLKEARVGYRGYTTLSKENADGTVSRETIPLDAFGRTNATRGERLLSRFYRGGFREIDPSLLTPAAGVRVPETFPAEGGLIQLERSGAIRPAQYADTQAWINAWRDRFRSKLTPVLLRPSFQYAVTRDVALPSALFGARSQSFLVHPNLPLPEGAGHSCVVATETEQGRSTNNCDGDYRESIADLWKLIAAPDPACRMVDLGSGARLEAVAIYTAEPKTSSWFGSASRIANVTVNTPGDVFLVLNAYDPVNWRIHPSSKTNVTGAFVVGYGKSSVEGLSQQIPIVRHHYEGGAAKTFGAVPACQRFANVFPSAHKGGPSELVLDRLVQAVTGRGLDAIRGGYSVNEVNIP